MATLKAENEASAAQCRQLVDDRARLDVEHRAQIESMTTAHEYMVRLLEEAKDKAVQEGGQTMLKLREAVDKYAPNRPLSSKTAVSYLVLSLLRLTTQSSSLEEKIELVAKTEKKNALLLKTLEAKEETVITLRNEVSPSLPFIFNFIPIDKPRTSPFPPKLPPKWEIQELNRCGKNCSFSVLTLGRVSATQLSGSPLGGASKQSIKAIISQRYRIPLLLLIDQLSFLKFM